MLRDAYDTLILFSSLIPSTLSIKRGCVLPGIRIFKVVLVPRLAWAGMCVLLSFIADGSRNVCTAVEWRACCGSISHLCPEALPHMVRLRSERVVSTLPVFNIPYRLLALDDLHQNNGSTATVTKERGSECRALAKLGGRH